MCSTTEPSNVFVNIHAHPPTHYTAHTFTQVLSFTESEPIHRFTSYARLGVFPAETP